MDHPSQYDVNCSTTRYQFWRDAQAAARAYHAYQKQSKELQDCRDSLNATITKNEDQLVSDTEERVEEHATAFYNKTQKLPIILGLVLYVIGIIIADVLTKGVDIFTFGPAVLFLALSIFRMTEFYEDLDLMGKLGNLVVSLITVGIDVYLINEVSISNWIAEETAPIATVYAVFCILARVISDVVPVVRKPLNALRIKIELKKAMTSPSYVKALKAARETDARLTENARKKAKKRLEELTNRETSETVNYHYYKDLCLLMLRYVRTSSVYDNARSDLDKQEYDIMVGICKKIGPLDDNSSLYPETIFEEAFHEYEGSREKIRQGVDNVMDMLGRF